jgi:hypothetical protein
VRGPIWAPVPELNASQVPGFAQEQIVALARILALAQSVAQEPSVAPEQARVSCVVLERGADWCGYFRQ